VGGTRSSVVVPVVLVLFYLPIEFGIALSLVAFPPGFVAWRPPTLPTQHKWFISLWCVEVIPAPFQTVPALERDFAVVADNFFCRLFLL
jgi:hypothetical protein